MNRALVVGVGNRFRRDDGVGPWIVDALRMRADTAECLEHSGEGAGLMALWAGRRRVVVVDAARSGSPPGTIHRFAAHGQPVPSKLLNYSTHAFSVAEAIEMSRALGTLPAELYLFGIEGVAFSGGAGLSAVVQAAAAAVLPTIETLLELPYQEDTPCTKCR